MTTTKLCCANIDTPYKVVCVSGNQRSRLSELGFTKDTEVRIIRHLMNHGPIEVAIRNFRIALRQEEAENIVVVKIESK